MGFKTIKMLSTVEGTFQKYYLGNKSIREGKIFINKKLLNSSKRPLTDEK